MVGKIGIRREDMYEWERRTPLIPADAAALRHELGAEILVQSSDKRAFTDDEYRAEGLSVVENLTDCPIIVALKEIPIETFEAKKTYTFFSHTIKGQPVNMPMLKRALDLGCTLIDYERIADDQGRRLIFFGNYAGLAGMIDTLWTLGKRLACEGIANPFETIQQASEYADLEEARSAIRSVGAAIREHGLPKEISPLAIGLAGYGNVSKGTQEILDLLPVTSVSAGDLLRDGGIPAGTMIAKVVFREEDTVERIDSSQPFELQEYYDHPERYRGVFSRYLPYLHGLVNCIYWEPKYPKLVTREDLCHLFESGQPRLRVIGDITCDVDGSIESTVRATESNDPVYVYHPETGDCSPGFDGVGPAVMAVDILPSELPREASAFFSHILAGMIPAIAKADQSAAFSAYDLPPELKRAVIVYRGELTPSYQYLETHLAAAEAV